MRGLRIKLLFNNIINIVQNGVYEINHIGT